MTRKKTKTESIITILKLIGYILLIIIAFLPFAFFYTYLRQKGKTVTFYPEFKIIDIKNNSDVSQTGEELTDATRLAEEILMKIGTK